MKKKGAGLLLRIIVVALLIYGVTTLVSLGGKISDARRAKEEMEQEIKDRQEANAEMEYKIENSDDDQVIEDVARDELDLVKPEEEIYYTE